MALVTTEKSDEKATVTISGELGILDGKELQRIFSILLKEYPSVAVSLEGVADVDLSALQFFCAAHKTALALKKHLSFTGPVPDVFFKMAADAGYDCQKGCAPDGGSTCLLIKGERDERQACNDR
ncbi:MAG TPA: STAS domain-containing protein [Syntrophorhabdaceae bacterium]|nr:STAS domain-containing protein [Syntrophorhabdaceae bacterium]